MRCSAVLTLLFSAGLLSGCAGAFDPYQRPGNWAMTGASRENIAQQAAYPSDLLSGRSSPTSSGVAASAGIDKALGGAAGTAAGLQTAPPALTQSGS
jgi:hypothetical protein